MRLISSMPCQDCGSSEVNQDAFARWVFDSWERVAVETITNTWNSIGLQGWQVEEAGAIKKGIEALGMWWVPPPLA